MGLIVLLIYKFGNVVYYNIKVPILRQLLWLLYLFLDLIFVKSIANSEISPKAKIRDNCTFVHGASGVFISSAVIGENAIIYHQVTIGVVNNKNGSPIIGKNVFIGAGAKLLGPITIGDNVKIGANAVVVTDVPSDATAVGVPARIIMLKNT